jgi:ribose transport system substrate-binding protein
VLDPRPIPASLDPVTAKPDIAQMTIKSTDLGSNPEVSPQWYDTLQPTPDQVKQICGMHLKAVFLDWADATYNQSIRSGVRQEFQALGVDLVRITSFNFDPNGLAGALAAVLPLNPDIIITGGTIDPNQMAAIMKPAADKGITIVSWAVGAKGWETGKGKPIASVISYDFFQLGKQMGAAVCKKYPNGAKLGYLHYINNVDAILLREEGFLEALKACPKIEVIADGGPADPRGSNSGFSDPNAATNDAAAFLARHSDINVLFAPWEDPPGLGEMAAIKQSGLEGKIDLVTMDLAETGARQLATANGTIKVDMAQDVYDGGRTMALAGAMTKAGLDVPAFLIFPTYAATNANLKDAWDFMHGPEYPLPVSTQ